MHMNEVHAVQSVFNVEIKLCDRHMVMKVKAAQIYIKKLKLKIQDTEHKKMELEGDLSKNQWSNNHILQEIWRRRHNRRDDTICQNITVSRDSNWP